MVAVVIVQRVRVRWGAHARGAPYADERSGIPEAYPLPSPPPAEDQADGRFVVHEVLSDGDAGYRPVSRLGFGAPSVEAAGLHLDLTDEGLKVVRTPGHAAYPPTPLPKGLFTLQPGQLGRYRANFRFWYTTCACAPYWYYESWTVTVAYAPARPDLFTSGAPDHEVDHRVHLYGGRPRRSTKQSA